MSGETTKIIHAPTDEELENSKIEIAVRKILMSEALPAIENMFDRKLATQKQILEKVDALHTMHIPIKIGETTYFFVNFYQFASFIWLVILTYFTYKKH